MKCSKRILAVMKYSLETWHF